MKNVLIFWKASPSGWRLPDLSHKALWALSIFFHYSVKCKSSFLPPFLLPSLPRSLAPSLPLFLSSSLPPLSLSFRCWWKPRYALWAFTPFSEGLFTYSVTACPWCDGLQVSPNESADFLGLPTHSCSCPSSSSSFGQGLRFTICLP